MKNKTYKLTADAFLPALRESDQQVIGSEELKEGDTLVRLRDFDLRKEHLVSAAGCGTPTVRLEEIIMATAKETATKLIASLLHETSWLEYEIVRDRALKEFVRTGKINGFLFLAPSSRKVWLSHFDIKRLKKTSFLSYVLSL